MLRKSLLCTAVLLTACADNPTSDESFRDGLPTPEMVDVKAPEESGQSRGVSAASVGAEALGAQSDTYVWTRTATVVVNGSTAWVLTLLEKVTKHPPTSVSGKTAVWGPHTDALSPNTWKLSVTQTGDHSYSYVLEAKGKSAPDSDFKAIISGTHTVAVDAHGARIKRFGSGNFLVDWDAEQSLPEHSKNVGHAEFRYARAVETHEVTVDADFRQVRDDERPGTRVDADYRYKATPGTGGEFEFAVDKNVDREAGRSAQEHLTIKSRWKQDGAGRADIQASGGDLGLLKAQVSECWDTAFTSRVFLFNYAPAFNYGNEAAECAFTTAAYASIGAK
ncbi:hypothetical protein P2318_12020 [Myxococcaceae bacterium GXIMD 01537]